MRKRRSRHEAALRGSRDAERCRDRTCLCLTSDQQAARTACVTPTAAVDPTRLQFRLDYLPFASATAEQYQPSRYGVAGRQRAGLVRAASNREHGKPHCVGKSRNAAGGSKREIRLERQGEVMASHVYRKANETARKRHNRVND